MIKLKMATWQPVVTLSITMTSHIGQGLHFICDKDNRVTSQSKSDDRRKIFDVLTRASAGVSAGLGN